MTADFGVRTRRSRMPIGRMIAILWIVAILGAVGAKFYLDRQAAIRNARAWAASGPPCPADTSPVFDGYKPGQRAFAFAGTKVLTDFKAVNCSTARDHGGLGDGEVAVCKLKGSTRIDLTTAKGRFRFLTPGRKATLSIEQGVATCALDAG